MIFNWSQYTPVTYGDYVFPKWAEGLGWGLACLSLVCIPIGMITALVQSDGDNLYQVCSSDKTAAMLCDICWCASFQRFRHSLRSLYDTQYELPDVDGAKQFEASNMAILTSKYGVGSDATQPPYSPLQDSKTLEHEGNEYATTTNTAEAKF